jgi:hypothetical protein
MQEDAVINLNIETAKVSGITEGKIVIFKSTVPHSLDAKSFMHEINNEDVVEQRCHWVRRTRHSAPAEEALK